MKEKIQTLFKEMIPVILGILIALFINNWKQSYDDQKFINSVLSSITEELKENHTELQEVIESHQQLLDTINYHIEDPEITIGELINKVGGIPGASIRNNAWKALVNNRIDLIEYDKISILSNIEEDKSNMKMKFERLTDLIYQGISSSEYIHKKMFLVTVNDLLYTEEQLYESHEQFIKLKH